VSSLPMCGLPRLSAAAATTSCKKGVVHIGKLHYRKKATYMCLFGDFSVPFYSQKREKCGVSKGKPSVPHIAQALHISAARAHTLTHTIKSVPTGAWQAHGSVGAITASWVKIQRGWMGAVRVDGEPYWCTRVYDGVQPRECVL
jgi:hypothetical protein